jgi:hypothetical protein
MRLGTLIFLVATLTTQAATYYADSTSGSDANAGESQDATWKTLQQVNSTELHAGDRVLFRSGSAWRGS